MRKLEGHSTDADLALRGIAPGQNAADTVGVAHEAGDEGIARLLVELARRAGLRDSALVHHDDAVGHGHRFRLVVRDVHDRQRQPLLQVADLLAHLPAQPRVEIGQRFVEEQHAGFEHERARDRHALLLPARQFRGQAPIEAGEADGCQRDARPFVRARRGHAGHDQPVAHVFQHGHVREQRIALEHHRHVAVGGGHSGYVAAADEDRAVAGQFEAGDQAQRGGLAAARRSQQRDQRPRGNGKGQIANRGDVAVHLADGAEFDRGGGHGCGRMITRRSRPASRPRGSRRCAGPACARPRPTG